MDEKDKIAIFKYGLITPVIHGNQTNQTRYFKEIAKNEYEAPGKAGKRKFKWRTFKKWLHLYRTYGYEGLKPDFRADKGKSRKIDSETGEEIRQLCIDTDFKTVSNLYRYLVSEEIIDSTSFTEFTLRNFIKANDIVFKPEERKPRKSFEAPHINILWTADFMHGPYVREGKKKMKAYLCAIIDDYSRVVTCKRFFLTESSLSLEKALKEAVLTYGIPQKLYCDNGKVFVSGYLHLVCARLGIALIHSKLYDSPSRGKIERFFRTVRDMFLANIKNLADLTLLSLNQAFKDWLDNGYHHNIHRGTGEMPVDRYINDIPNVKIKEISENECNLYFYHTVYRKVKNDSTITFRTSLYETPPKYIGKKVEIRFPLENPKDLRLFEDNKQITSLKRLDKHFNSQNTIRYHREEENDV